MTEVNIEPKIIKTRIQNKYDTAEKWTTNNPKLFLGEIGFESDTKMFKIGDGEHRWNELPYVAPSISHDHESDKINIPATAEVDWSTLTEYIVSHKYSDTELETQFETIRNHGHTIQSLASDDGVVVLTAQNDHNLLNTVGYEVKHNTSGVSKGTYSNVTVDERGHVIAGSNPMTLAGYNISDAYTKNEIDAFLADKSNNHEHPYLPNTIKYAKGVEQNGAAESANKVNSTLTVQLNSGVNDDTDKFIFDGSNTKTINITPGSIGTYTKTEVDAKLTAKSDKHDHFYAGSDTQGGPANSTKSNITLKKDGKGDESGTSFDGSTNVSISYNSIGAAAEIHNHDGRYYTESEIDSKLENLAANKQDKLGSVGSTIQPIYLENGEFKTTTYELNATVPAGAKFTDTTYDTATTSKDGLMSSTDKSNLDTLTNLLKDDDANTTVDTIKEVLNVFKDYSEQTTIVNVLASKANTSHGTHVTETTVKTALGTSSDGTRFLKEDGSWAIPTDTKYTHPKGNCSNKETDFYKFSTDTTSHISNITKVTKEDITSLGIPAENTWRGIQNNLTSTSTSDSLSAAQGKVLKEYIDEKITANTAITSATKCKITYDSKGLVTTGADLIASDIPDLDAAKITSGTFADARIASANIWNAKQDAITSTNKLSTDKINGLATVATSGSYEDLLNKPTISVSGETLIINL